MLSVLLYVLATVLVYRASWSTLTADRSTAEEEESKAERSIQYDHHTYLGLRYYDRRDLRSAEMAFRKSIEYGPDRPLAYNNLGSVLNAEGRWDESIAVLERARSLDSSLAIVENNLKWARAQRAKQRPMN